MAKTDFEHSVKAVHPMHAKYMGGEHTVDPGSPSPMMNMADRSMKPASGAKKKVSGGHVAKATAHAIPGD